MLLVPTYQLKKNFLLKKNRNQDGKLLELNKFITKNNQKQNQYNSISIFFYLLHPLELFSNIDLFSLEHIL